MATVNMDDIRPEKQEPETKPEMETIVIDDKDVTIEDSEPEKSNNAIVAILKKSPRVYNALKYGVDRIIFPALQSMAHRFLYSLVDFIIYESPRGRGSRDREPIDYNGRFRDSDLPFDHENDDVYIHERPFRTTRNEQFGLHQIGFRTRESAKICLRDMQRELDEKGKVSVQYFYKYIGKEPPGRLSWQWGWVSLNEASIVPIPKGFKIVFPEVVNLR